MTKREQERCDAALSYLKDSKLDLPQVVKASSYFIAGAKWGEKTTLNRVCEYLEANHSHFAEHFNDEIRKAIEEEL